MSAQDTDGRDALERLGIPANPVQAADVREDFHAWISARFRLDDDLSSALTLAVNEALANAVEHAYADRTDTGSIDFVAQYCPDQHELTVVVLDRGRWREPPPDPLHLHGRGIPLMRGLADEMALVRDDDGSTVRLRWRGLVRKSTSAS